MAVSASSVPIRILPSNGLSLREHERPETQSRAKVLVPATPAVTEPAHPPVSVRPRFSVIIPLEFHRGQAEKCLRAWMVEQTFAREDFEVVVACPEAFPEEEATALRGLMGKRDRFLTYAEHHDMALCELAARDATGEILVFTESHVVPEATLLQVVARALQDQPTLAGVSCCSIPITHNLLSQVEADLYDPDIQYAMEKHPWRKVLDQGFAIRREPYFEAGGFESQYGHFAEWLLAARLYRLGYRISFLPEARIHHYYIGELHDWTEFTEDFVDGQMRYLAHAQTSAKLNMDMRAEASMFEEVPEWSTRPQYQRSTALRMLRLWWRQLGKALPLVTPHQHQDAASSTPAVEAMETSSPQTQTHAPTQPRVLASLWHWSCCAVLGAWRLILPAWCGWLRSQLALRWNLLRHDRAGALRAYHACWRHLVTLRRGWYLRQWSRDQRATGSDGNTHDRTTVPFTAEAPPAPGRATVRFPGLVTAPAGAGFHLGETAYGETLRWCEPAAYVTLPMEKGRHSITLRWLRTPTAVQFYFNETPVPPSALEWRTAGVQISVQAPHAGEHRLGWICPPHAAPNDTRLLGFALRRITWRSGKKPPAPSAASAIAMKSPADAYAFLPSAADFTPAETVNGSAIGIGWYPREQSPQGRWICWMGGVTHASLDLRLEPRDLRDSVLTCEFPQVISSRVFGDEQLQVQVNGIPLERQHLRVHQEGGSHLLTSPVPAAMLQLSPERVRLTFLCRERQRPSELSLGNQDARMLSVALGRVRLVPVV